MTREERTAHIDLTTPCIFPKNPSNKKYRKALIDYTDMNPGRWWFACHACENDSHNGMCANPLHLYWGTSCENSMDIPPEKRKRPGNGCQPKSAETRAKMAEARKAYWERKRNGAKISPDAVP